MKSNKKQKQTVTSTIENLSKELQERIVNVGIGIPFSGTINHTNVNSDFSPFNRNALTKEKIFPNPTTTIPVDLSKENEPKKEESKDYSDISISVNYGTSGGSIKRQLKEQGFKFDKDFIKGCEDVRIDILSLLDVDILTTKQGQKAFTKLNTMISENVIEMTFGDVKSKLKKNICK